MSTVLIAILGRRGLGLGTSRDFLLSLAFRQQRVYESHLPRGVGAAVFGVFCGEVPFEFGVLGADFGALPQDIT